MGIIYRTFTNSLKNYFVNNLGKLLLCPEMPLRIIKHRKQNYHANGQPVLEIKTFSGQTKMAGRVKKSVSGHLSRFDGMNHIVEYYRNCRLVLKLEDYF